ncbi:unnamed protein product [Effrenium voratum]|nr:unnamed protein product [Effrenium voratum]
MSTESTARGKGSVEVSIEAEAVVARRGLGSIVPGSMVFEAARMLAASVHFCVSLSLRLRRFAGADTDGPERSERSSITAAARDVRELAESDKRTLKAFRADMEQVPTAAWWLLANLALCTFILSLLALPYFSSTLLFASLNGICVLVKTRGRLYRHTSLRLSLMTLRGYMTSQLQLILGAGLVFILPTLLLNIPFWLAIHIFLSATALCWPALLLEPLTPRTMNALSVVMVSWWLLWKTAMLLEILINHSFYRSALAARRDSATPSFSYHLCDSVYAYSYSVLGFQLGWEAVHFCARFVYLVSPFSWSGMGILLMLGLRASIAPFGQGAKSVMHWSMHRMLHVQPFYACWHKEHHFAASQTCLTACQDCGLLETGPEAAYVQLCFVFIPFFDNCAYAWNSAYNTLIHHYYEEYRSWHWKLAGAMVRLQSKVRRVVSRMEWGTWLRSDFSPLSPFPPFWPLFALNLQFPSADYASAYFAEGPIEKHWHGRHHWTTEKHFGYGTYDSVSNLVWDSSSEEQEQVLVQFLEEYLKLQAGQIQSTSILSLVAEKKDKKVERQLLGRLGSLTLCRQSESAKGCFADKRMQDLESASHIVGLPQLLDLVLHTVLSLPAPSADVGNVQEAGFCGFRGFRFGPAHRILRLAVELSAASFPGLLGEVSDFSEALALSCGALRDLEAVVGASDEPL